MSGVLGDDHYICRLRAGCLRQPELNRHQLVALDRELVLASRAGSAEAHLAASRDLLELARAAMLDRAANDYAVARRYDDPWGAAAAGREYLGAFEGEDHVSLMTNHLAVKELTGPLRAHGEQMMGAFGRLFENLLLAKTACVETGPAWAEATAYWHELRAGDPLFAEETWLEQPRYRTRLPWTSPAPGEWIAKYWQLESGVAAAIPEDPGSAMAAAEARWRERMGSHEVAWPEAEPWPVTIAMPMVEEYARRQREWPDGLVARHWEETGGILAGAGTEIALYALAQEREARWKVDATWNGLCMSAVLAPLRAAATVGGFGEEMAGEGLRAASATVYDLIGYGPRALLELPRVKDFLERNLAPRLTGGCEGFGAWRGEPGFDLVRHATGWLAASGALDWGQVMGDDKKAPAAVPPVRWGGRVEVGANSW
ncbi:MAG: hypothetical protein NTV52_32440 [Acidobacteria bacterium]|nr:hypothetical protein [Acidobacteriota bacterium]